MGPNPTSLRIAVISTPHIKTPPRGYGGSEEVAGGLSEELGRRGHQVTLYATPDSQTSGNLRAFAPALPAGPYGHAGYREILQLCHALATESYDLVLNHCLQAVPALALYHGSPVFTTLHYHPPAVDYFPALDYVAVSHRQAWLAAESGLHLVGVAHNGIDPAPYHWQTPKEDYLLWIGRFHYYKGPDLAIEIAERLNARLLLAAPPPPEDQQAFFVERVQPKLRGRIEWIGGVEGEDKYRLFERARCTLCPLRWEEPFGLVMIESMAAGVPVVASRRGAAPEIVADGETGILADDAAGMAAAVEMAAALSPAACRRRVEEHFTCRQMTDAYLALYRNGRSEALGPGPM